MHLHLGRPARRERSGQDRGGPAAGALAHRHERARGARAAKGVVRCLCERARPGRRRAERCFRDQGKGAPVRHAESAGDLLCASPAIARSWAQHAKQPRGTCPDRTERRACCSHSGRKGGPGLPPARPGPRGRASNHPMVGWLGMQP